MNRTLVKTFRRVKKRLIRFERKRRPIVVFALRRGGSTLLAETIADRDGVWYANEPYAVHPIRPGYETRLRLLPQAPHAQLFHLRGEALAKFDAYTHALLEARLWEIGTCRRTLPVLRADRVCLKVLTVPWMIGRFHEISDAHLLTLLRHPGAQALSVMRQGWALLSGAYLARREELERDFSVAQLDFAAEVLAGDDPWRKAILDWVLTSHPLRHADIPGLIRVRYEDLVLDPESFVDRVLVGTFGLERRDEMVATFKRPSGSSDMSEQATLEAIRSGRREELVGRWRNRTDPAMRRAGQEILDRFEVAEFRIAD